MNLTNRRMLEWWALLNCFVRPSDMPRGDDESDAFQFLTEFCPREKRLAFWNGAFRHGLGREEYR